MPRRPLGVFLPIYISDWRGSSFVAGLTLEEEGLFLRCLFYQWEHGALPLANPRLYRLVGVTEEEWQRGWQTVAPAFGEDGVNESLERKRAYHQRQSRAGKHGSDGRWGGKGDGKGGAKGMALREQRTENREPDTNPASLQPSGACIPSRTRERAGAGGMDGGVRIEPGGGEVPRD